MPDLVDTSSQMRKTLHEVVYVAVMSALKVAQPRLPEAGATPIAVNAAVKASAEIERLWRDGVI